MPAIVDGSDAPDTAVVTFEGFANGLAQVSHHFLSRQSRSMNARFFFVVSERLHRVNGVKFYLSFDFLGSGLFSVIVVVGKKHIDG